MAKDNGIEQSTPNGQEDVHEVNEDQSKALEEANAELLYLRAEFDNYKKRILRDQEQSVRFANEKILNELLTVVDLFDRAVTSAQSLKSKVEPNVASFISGVEMTQKELDNLVTRFGVEFVGAAGEKFDPNRHEAIAQQPCTPEKNETVLSVVQRGSALNGRLLKPAKVVVGKSELSSAS